MCIIIMKIGNAIMKMSSLYNHSLLNFTTVKHINILLKSGFA